jgi:hypothetical protein
MTKTEAMLCQFIADHEGVLDVALRSYAHDMRETADKEGLATFAQTFNESADKAEKARDAFEALAEAAENLEGVT